MDLAHSEKDKFVAGSMFCTYYMFRKSIQLEKGKKKNV